jgi:hypothetical protein
LKVDWDVDARLVYLSQSHYIDDMQTCFLGTSHIPVATPMDANFKLLVPLLLHELPSSGSYNQLVGSLLWAAQCTHPDVLFAVNRLSQFLQDFSQAHWKAALTTKICNSTQEENVNLGWEKHIPNFTENGQK